MKILLNLIPQVVLRQRESAARRRFLVGVPLLVLVGAVASYSLLVQQEAQARRGTLAAEQSLAPLRPVVARLTRLQAEIEELARQQQEREWTPPPRQAWSDLLAEVSRLIPQDAWLQSLTITGDGVAISGAALSVEGAARFAENLMRAPSMTNVQVRLQQKRSAAEPVVQFQITARLRAGGR